MTDFQEYQAPISAPPAQDEETLAPAVPAYVTVPTSGTHSDVRVETVYRINQDEDPYGRVSVVLGARGSEQAMICGAILPYDQFCIVRDQILAILETPAPMRVGYFEFLADRDEGGTHPEAIREDSAELMFLSQENVLGISVEMFDGPHAEISIPVLTRVARA